MTDYNPFIERAGVPVIKYKNKPAVDARIERLGEISDRRKAATENKDKLALLEIAFEYETKFKHMKKTARLLRAEVAEMR